MGITESACMTAQHSPGPEVCSCAQDMADRTLTPKDQQMAARIIADPDMYLEFKNGRNRARKDFIDRYMTWGELAHQQCGES